MPIDETARVRIVLPAPAIAPQAANALTVALSKLFAQFIREKRCAQCELRREHDGAAYLIAWAPDVDLSGCSHDKIHAVLAAHEQDGQRLLDTPPLVVRVDGRWQGCTRRDLRALLAAGRVGPTTDCIDTSCRTLGEWRQRGITALGAHPVAPVLWPVG